MTALTILLAVLLLLVLADRLAPITTARLGMGLDRWRCGLSLRQATVGGLAMPYLEGGHGEALLLIHGFGGDKDNFTRIANYLTRHYHVLIPDLPGFGDAARDTQASYLPADQVARLHAWLGQLGIERLHLGGNSMGGYIAAQFAATYPQMVASVWLLDPAGTAASYETDIVRHYAATGDMPLLLRSVRDFPALIKATTHRRPFIPPAVRTALARRAVADYALHSRIMRDVSAAPLLETQYKDLATPAYIVWGERDQILSPAGAQAFKGLFPHSRVNIMPDIGHLPMLETPRRTARDYLAFRRDVAATQAI